MQVNPEKANDEFCLGDSGIDLEKEAFVKYKRIRRIWWSKGYYGEKHGRHSRLKKLTVQKLKDMKASVIWPSCLTDLTKVESVRGKMVSNKASMLHGKAIHISG